MSPSTSWAGAIDWSRAAVDPGTKHHVVIDRRGTPLAALLGPANRNDHPTLEAVLDAARAGTPRLPGSTACAA